jgi:hypothetical protein
MSITPKHYAVKDGNNVTPDASLRQESYFNTDDGCIYRIIDFIMVQEPDIHTTEMRSLDVRGEGYQEEVPMPTVISGMRRWYIILDKVGSDERLAVQYDDFRNNLNSFHRIKNASQNDKPVFRRLGGDAAPPEDSLDLRVLGNRTPERTPHRRGATRSHVPSESDDDLGVIGRSTVMGQDEGQPINLSVR